jgi:hypothetical protein
MKAARAVKTSAVGLILCTLAACSGHSAPAASPLHTVPTSSWRPGDPSLTALGRGTLRGGYERGTFCVWLAGPGLRDEAVVWPAGYHARSHPLELLDAHNVVVAKGGDLISFGGGESPVHGRTCMLGQKSAFYVMSTVSVIRRH